MVRPEAGRGGLRRSLKSTCAILPLLVLHLSAARHLMDAWPLRLQVPLGEQTLAVIASGAKQSRSRKGRLDCFVARAPRNDGAGATDVALNHLAPVSSVQTALARCVAIPVERRVAGRHHHALGVEMIVETFGAAFAP